MDRFLKMRSQFLIYSVTLALVLTSSDCTRRRPERENTLRVAMRDKFKTMDPAHASEYYSNIEVARAYEGLLQYNYEKRPYELEPMLAEGMPEVSKDRLIYTFKIKKGVHFQNDRAFKGGKGRELTADDVIYSFSRISDPHESSEGQWIFANIIAEMKALDRYTVQIRLKHPHPLLPYYLATPYAMIVPREAVQYYGKDFNQHPVGTGPFQLEDLQPNRIVWRKNPTFRIAEYPYVDKIEEDVIIEDETAWLNFKKGNHDYILRVPKDNAVSVWGQDHEISQEMKDANIQVLTAPAMDFRYVLFNMEDPVVGGASHRFLRQAMSLAYDEAPMIDKFYLGLAINAESPIPPGVFGYDSSYRNPNRIYNLAHAREILSKAGHPDGAGIPELVYDCLSETAYRQSAEYFQRSMAQLGLKIKINMVTWAEYFNRVRSRRVQLADASWIYDYPDPENGYQLLYGKNASPGPNEANYKNAKFDALYEKAVMMSDNHERRAVFNQMRRYLEEDIPWILQVHRVETRLVHPWIGNFKIHAFEYNVEKYLKLDRTLRSNALQ